MLYILAKAQISHIKWKKYKYTHIYQQIHLPCTVYDKKLHNTIQGFSDLLIFQQNMKQIVVFFFWISVKTLKSPQRLILLKAISILRDLLKSV